MSERASISPSLLTLLSWGGLGLGLLLFLFALLDVWGEDRRRSEIEALSAAVEVGARFAQRTEAEGDLLEVFGRLVMADDDIADALARRDTNRLLQRGAPFLDRLPARLISPTLTFIDAAGTPLAELPRASAPPDIPPPASAKASRQLHLKKDGQLTLAVTLRDDAVGGGLVLQYPVERFASEGVAESRLSVVILGPKEGVDRRQWEERLRREGWSVRWERLGELLPLAPPGGEPDRQIGTLERALTADGTIAPYTVIAEGRERVEVVALPLAGPVRSPGIVLVGVRPFAQRFDRRLIGLAIAFGMIVVGLAVIVRRNRRRMVDTRKGKRDADERLTEISRIARLGFWEWQVGENAFLLSEEAQRILGFSSSETRVAFDRLMERVHPGDRRALGERVAWPRPGDFTFRAFRDGDDLRTLRGSLEPSTDQKGRVVGYVQDITDLAKAEADLSESEQRYRELSMAATEGIVIHDGGIIVDVNNAFCRLMGGEESDLVGKNLLDLAEPDDVPLLATRLESERDRTERFRLRGLTGQTVSVEITSRSAPSHGRIVRMSAVRDVSGVVRAEESAEGQRRLMAQTDRLRSLGTLVAGVAHEINNPNSFVMFNAPLIERAWRDATLLLDEREREKGSFTLAGMPYQRVRGDVLSFIENILSGARRIQEIVEKLRSFVGGATPGELELIDPVKIAEEGVTILSPLITRRKGVVSVRSVGRILPIRGRSAEIGQVVVNLVANALQALPDTGGAVTVKTVGEAARGTVAIIVEDNGPGISPLDLEKIFDPFHTTKRSEGGTGLGLSISHTIVEEHGGRLTVESTLGVGTRVTARFPVADTIPREGKE